MAEPNVGVVRGATNHLLGLYDQVKHISPLLQFGFEKVERVPWKKADPVIDVLDTRINLITQTVSSQVVAIQNKYQTGKEVVVSKYQNGKAAMTGQFETGKAVVAKSNEKWKDLRGDLSKKAGARIEKGLQQLQEFSATRGKEIIHIDLIQYSREVVDGASEAVTKKLKPVYEPIAKNLAVSVQKVNHAANQLRQSLAEAPERAQLRVRLKKAQEAARELSRNGVAYAQTKYGDFSSRLPESSSLHKGLQFIESSPEIFSKIKTDADLDFSKGLLENIHNLVVAIRDVVLHSPEQVVPTEDFTEIPEDGTAEALPASEEEVEVEQPGAEVSGDEGDNE